MSKHNNVNPDHYKVAGREPQGKGIVHSEHKEELTRKQARGETPTGKKEDRPSAKPDEA